VTILQDYLAGNATAEQVRAEVAKQRQGMRKATPPYPQPDLSGDPWAPPSIFEEVTIAQAVGKLTREQADALLAPTGNN
jgi:hypothetical protein